MDAMALLCTLHADGPATLRLLRESGCTTLETLRELGDERLAALLDVPPAAARRLLREADALRVRLGDDLLEREEAPVEFSATRRSAPELAAAEPTPRGGGERLGARDRDLMQRVLSSWRERDASDDGGAPEAARAPREELRAPVVSERHDWLTRTSPRSPLRAPTAPVAEHEVDRAAAPAGLVPGGLDGLNEEVCRRLATAGVQDLEALRRADALALARSTGLGFTAISRLCFLARRDAPAGPAASQAAPTRTAAPRAAPAASLAERFSIADEPPRPGREPLLTERDYELRPRPPAARGVRNERGPEVPGGPFA